MTKEEILKALDTKVSDGTITEILREIVNSTSPIVIAPKVGETTEVDAYALGQLAKILEKKDTSIFDVVMHHDNIDETITRVNDVFNGRRVGFIMSEDHTVNGIDIPYTSTQYEGLAAVQEAYTEGIELKIALPDLAVDNDSLFEIGSGNFITDLEGHKIAVTTTDDDKLATVSISEEVAVNCIEVAFEDIQKLIGLPILVNEPEQG